MFMPFGRQAVRDLCLLILGAFLYTVAFPPYGWSSVGWLALTPLFLVLRGKTPWTAFGAGFLYAMLWCSGMGYWVYPTVVTYFPLAFPLDILFILFCYGLFAGISTGLAASFSCYLMRWSKPIFCWAGIPALWVSSEFVRSDLCAGFAWGILGYTQYRSLPLIQSADITGVYGLTFLMVLSSYWFAETLASLRNRRQEEQSTHRLPWLAFGCLAGGVLLVWLYGMFRLHQYHPSSSSSPIEVALIHGGVPSEQRWKRAYAARTLLEYVSVTRQGIGDPPPDLIVWPEFSLSFYLDRERSLRAQLSRFVQQIRSPLLLGAPRMEESQTGKQYYNAAYFFSPKGQLIDVYSKIRLVPFTEYSPFILPAVLDHTLEAPSEFTAGRHSTVFPLPKSAFGVLICFEATYPSLARRLVRGGSQFLVNISNEAWLIGDAAAVAQHFSMAVFRAVENRRHLIRVATAGISGFVDPLGRPFQLSIMKEGIIQGKVIPQQEITSYTQYGDWFAWTCVGFSLVALLSAVWMK